MFDSEIIVFLLSFGSILLGIPFECDELTHEVLVYVHNGCIVIKVSTIVLGAENGDKLLILTKESIPIFHYLMSSAYEIKIMFL